MKTKILDKREIEAIIESQFGLRAEVQVVTVKGEARTLYVIEDILVGRRTTVAGVEDLCRRICKALGAELYGSVNFEFGTPGVIPAFAMVAEVADSVPRSIHKVGNHCKTA